MIKKGNFWKNYWDSLSEGSLTDYEIDRGVLAQEVDFEPLSEDKTLNLVDHKMTDSVFDAGCGTGVNISKLGSQVKSIVGMDYSAGMIKRAKNRMADENLHNVDLFVGNIANIPSKTNCFDKVICISVMHYLTDEECENALSEFTRISKDGAILVLHVKNLSSLYLFTLFIAKKLKRVFWGQAKIEHYRTRRWYEKKLSESGMRILDYYSENILLIDFLPKSFSHHIKLFESKYLKNKFFMKYGADLNMKVKIK